MKWVILVLLLAVSVLAQEVVMHNIVYNSSVSNISLDALVFTDNKTGVKPVVVVMHSYAGTSSDVIDVGERFARLGMVVVAPNLRGRAAGESYTQGDDGMYDLFDIYDAINEVVRDYSGDNGNVNILGYSGGGANAMHMVQKFPDLFNNAYSFFGIPNYCDGAGSWYADGLYDKNRLSLRIGNGSENLHSAFPNRCLARNALKLIPNALKTRTRLFVDEDEAIAPLRYSQEYLWEYQKRGLLLNTHLDVSSARTQFRYTHGYPKDVPGLLGAEPSIAGEILQGGRDVSLNAKGKLRAGGYVKTKPFSVFVGDEVFEGDYSKGREGLVEVDYDVQEKVFSFTDKSYAPGAKSVTLVWHGAKPNEGVSVRMNGKRMRAVANAEGDAYFIFVFGEEQGKSFFSAGVVAGVALMAAGAFLIVRRVFR